MSGDPAAHSVMRASAFRSVLPIDAVLPALLHALVAAPSAVLVAPPGAGKTTRVPLALLDAPWRDGRRILMLEPRRLAARAAAQFMAQSLGERVGGRVGYRVRGDTRVSRATCVEVVTEGVLTRMLSDDATLESYAAVLFDEFHERSLHADLGLALTLETQQVIRPDLRIVVMSATLESDRVAELLQWNGQLAPVVQSEGRLFPVHTHYRAPRPNEYLDASVARAVREALQDNEGDVLVFLPGMTEQRRVADRLHGDDTVMATHAAIHLLHGSLPLAEQDAAISASAEGRRKVVLATSIAETSLTIEGVRVVVDSGVSRIPQYDARAGLTRLATVRVSKASANQRRGRAGRVAPGVCYRLWHEAEDHALMPRSRPEILDADLSSLALELANAGVHDTRGLRWMDEPPVGAMTQARALLVMLGALDEREQITAHGKQMAALPLAPRLAHLLIESTQRGLALLGAELVALLEERDILRGEGVPAPADMRLRLEVLRRRVEHGDSTSLHGARIDRDALRRVRELVTQLTSQMTSQHPPQRALRASRTADLRDDDLSHAGELLALGFPDRVAQRRPGSAPRFLLRSGTGVMVPRGDALADAQWLAVADLEGKPPEYRVARALPLASDDVTELFAAQVTSESIVEWDADTSSVRAFRQTALGALVLSIQPLRDVPPAQLQEVLLGEIRSRGVEALPWSDSGARTRARMACAHRFLTDWPDVSAAALEAHLEEWLGPHISGIRRWSELASQDWSELMLALLPWNRRAALEQLVPSHMEVPSGSRIAIDYADAEAPVLAVKLQEVFGWMTTPHICDGRVPLTLQLLSPAQRPVQVTRDLAGFWRQGYFDVRKDLRGRYPRHPWPEDPLTATATRRAKPRGT